MDTLTRLQVSGPMASKEFAAHVLYCSQKPDTNDNKTGARAVADAFLRAGLVIENEGKISAATTSSFSMRADEDQQKNASTEKPWSEESMRRLDPIDFAGSPALACRRVSL